MAVDLQAPPDREKTAGRLLASSRKLSYDPEVDVDWTQPWVDGLYFTSPENSSLYGSRLWDRMTEQQRIDLTRHEVASVASTGIWFEVILGRWMFRDLYWKDPINDHARYALVEIGDECRHSTMFSRLIDYLDAPYYGPPTLLKHAGNIFNLLADEATALAGILYVEAVLDQLQRDAVDDERVQPVCRMVNKIHVTEEARHMTYAREEMARQWHEVGRRRRSYDRLALSIIAMMATDELISPSVFGNAGLNQREAVRARAANPVWRERRHELSRNLFRTFDELGMVSRSSRLIWKAAHLG